MLNAVLAQDTLRLTEKASEYCLTRNDYFILQKEGWGIEDAMANAELFEASAAQHSCSLRGTSKETIWIKFYLYNPSQVSFLQLSHTHLEKLKIYFFIPSKDTLITKNLSLTNRNKINYKFKYPTVIIPKYDKITCYIELNAGGNTSASDIILSTRNQLFKSEVAKNVYYGIYFGAMLLLILIYGLVYVLTRNIGNIFFMLFLISFLMYIAISCGLYYLYLPPGINTVLSSKWAPAMWINLSCLSACAYSRRYLFGNFSLKSVYISPHIIFSILILLVIPFGNVSLFHALSHCNMVIASLIIFYSFLFKSPYLHRTSKYIILTGNSIFSLLAFTNILAYEGFITISSNLNNTLLEVAGLTQALFNALGHFTLYLKEQSDVNKQLIKEQERIIRLRMDENSFKRERVKNLQDKKERAQKSLNDIQMELASITTEIEENNNAILIGSKNQAKVSRQIAENSFVSKDILNSLPDMVIIVDDELKVIDYNDKFEKMNKIMGIQITRGQNLISQINPTFRHHYEKHYAMAFSQNRAITKSVFYKNAILTDGYWLNITYKVFNVPELPTKRFCVAFAKHKSLK